MNPRLTLLTVLLLGGRLAAAIPFTECEVDGVRPPFVAKTVLLEPNTPQPGGTASFTIVGENELPAVSGEFITDVFNVFHFMGQTTMVPLQKESRDLCEHTECPVKQGEIEIKYERRMPIVTPPGEYMVKVVAKDESGKPLMCVQVNFHVTRKHMPVS